MRKLNYIDVILTFNITFYLIIVLNPAYSLELPEIPPRPSLDELKTSLGSKAEDTGSKSNSEDTNLDSYKKKLKQSLGIDIKDD